MDSEIAQIASRILTKEPGSARFVEAEVRSIVAFDGTPAVRVVAKYRDRPREAERVGLDAMHAIRDALLSEGDDRFVYLENEYIDEIDPPVDDAA